MDLQYFLNILLRRKWLILSVALVAALATFFLVDRQDHKFQARASLATGIVDITGLDLNKDNPWIQQFYVDMGFGNLIELITSQRNVIFLTYRLLLHDLGPEGVNSETPFRILDAEQLDELPYSQAQVDALKRIIRNKLDSLKYTLNNPPMERIFKDLANAYNYDYESLMKYHITVERKGETDLLNINFTSENPKLSAFAVNHFCRDFLKNYQMIQQEEEHNSVLFYGDQVKMKKEKVDSLRLMLRNYQDSRNLADLSTQREAVIAQIKELENRKQDYLQKIPSYRSSIADMNRYLDENNSRKTEDKAVALVNNPAIVNLQNQIAELEDAWIESNYTDDRVRRRLELTKKNRDERLEQLSRATKTDDDTTIKEREEKLLKERIDLEIKLAEAQSAVESLDRTLIDLRIKSNSFVSNEDYISRLRQELKIAEDQYEIVYSDFSNEKRELDNSTLPIQIFESAQVPDKALPKRRALLAGFAGVVGGTFASVLVFFLAFVDYSVSSPHKFRKFAKAHLLGTLNRINPSKVDLHKLFSSKTSNKNELAFRESIRNLRYILEHSGSKRFLFTSPRGGEGKTFVIVSLAHALTLKGKKILLVDTNFKNNTLTRMSEESMQDNLLSTRLLGETNLDDEFETKKIHTGFKFDNVDIIGNKGSFQSPSEVFADKDFHNFIDRIADNYDYIFLESAALNLYSDTKELTDFVEKVICVISADTTIKSADENSLAFLKSLKNQFLGCILNKVHLKNLK